MQRSRTRTVTTGTLALVIVGWSLSPYPAQGLPRGGDDARAREPAPAERLSGRAIADQVLERLRADPVVDTGTLGVVVVDGALTISGTAPSLAVKERAERIAEEVRGVTSVSNRVRVRPVGPRTDRQIEQYVERALATDPALARYDLDAKVTRGVVTLRGAVSSGAERQLARALAAEVFAVRGVRERLTVTPAVTMATRASLATEPTTTDVTTAALSTTEPAELSGADERRQDVLEALAWDARVDARALEVRVEGSAAVLTGAVATLAERRRAIEAAYVPGVHDVDARGLTVAPTKSEQAAEKRPDASLADAIAKGFARHPRLDDSEIRVELDVSIITLRGVVDSLAARRAASEVALSHVGVREVRNRLRVEPSLRLDDAEAATRASAATLAATPAAMPPVEEAAAPAARWSDEDLAEEVREALRRDPYLHTTSIRVDVVAGEAYLDGEVTSAFERARAAEVVGRVRGVSDLHDELEVAAPQPGSTAAALACDPAGSPADAPSENPL